MRKKKSGPVGKHRARQDEGLIDNPPLTPLSILSKEPDAIRRLHWRKAGRGWQLYGEHGRRFGKVIPDANIRGMWRTPLSGGRMSDMANLSWARAAVLEAAVRELEWEARQSAVTTPSNSQGIRGVFSDGSPPVRSGDSPPMERRRNDQKRAHGPPSPRSRNNNVTLFVKRLPKSCHEIR
jgi:hypothetical protein